MVYDRGVELRVRQVVGTANYREPSLSSQEHLST